MTNNNLQREQEIVSSLAEETNLKIENLGKYTQELSLKLNAIQLLFDNIRGIPNDKELELEELKKIRLNGMKQVERIEAEYKIIEAKAVSSGIAGVGAGVAVATLGPTAAMGVATTFGVASTGTAISALSGAAATNAALAWLGGGMAAGNLLLGLAGPVGWTIAGITFLGSSLLYFKSKDNKKRLENIFLAITKREKKSYQLSAIELDERIKRITSESILLDNAIKDIKTYGTNYNEMTEHQQYNLMTFVNLMNATTQLLINPILGLQPKFSKTDLDKYNDKIGIDDKKEEEDFIHYSEPESEFEKILEESYKSALEEIREKRKKIGEVIIYLANLFYKIDMDDKDRLILWKFFKKNKTFLDDLKLTKEEFKLEIFDEVQIALEMAY